MTRTITRTITRNNHWNLLISALEDRALVNDPVNFWLRDDDAVAPTESLERLLKLSDEFSIPLTLAVIPEHTGDALAQRLDLTANVSVVVHGWSHSNHAPSSEKKQELGNHRPSHEILAQLQCGMQRLSHLHGLRFVPLLVPPWNRISSEVFRRVNEIGFAGVSTFGEEKPAEMKSINTQVDIVDWRGSRGGRSHTDLVTETVALLQAGRSSIGILTHHLVHDEQCWSFLQQLFEATSKHPGARWPGIRELLYQ